MLDRKVARACAAGRLLNILEILTESPKSLDEKKIYAGLSRHTNPVSLADFSFSSSENYEWLKDELRAQCPFPLPFPGTTVRLGK